MVSCSSSDEDIITEQNFNPEEIAPFVEPDFPFITTSVDARELGESFPNDNITPRCLALRLGSEAYACFDTDMLRWSVAWTGDFLPMVTMGQISYRDFHNKDNEIPLIAGDPQIATGLYPGWMGAEPEFTDPRPPAPNPDGPSWGPLPLELGRYNGLYMDGQEVLLSYTAQNTDIYEKPGVVSTNGVKAFTRTFQVDSPGQALSLAAAEVANGTNSEVSGNTALIYQGEEQDTVTVIGLAGDTPGVELEVTGNRYATANLSAADSNVNFTVVLWKGPAGEVEQFDQLLAQADTNIDLAEFKNGGPARWSETVHTRGQLAPDTAAYVIDRLTLPIPNPWKRNVRVVDASFFDDNSAALVTFEGDLWLVDGIDDELESLEWKRYASGLYEPQSIEVVDNEIYVFGKEGITHLQDLNDDGSADYYRNFSSLMEQSIETREWASGMVVAPDGTFYVSKFGALDMGPETSSPKSIMGFRAGSHYGGSIVEISPDGRQVDHYATGFRGPYLGINPETGVVTASDQQGHYMPSTPIYMVDKGDYYGVPATAHRDPLPEITPPLTWIPHSVDRSGTGQVWVNSDKMGPLSGQMVHLSYGRPGMFKVMIDSTSDAVQGGVSFIKGNYPAPTMKGDISPADGQLYVAGFSLWGSNSDVISSFVRLRYTGQESLLPQDFSVRDGGVMLRFGTELDEEAAKNIANYRVKRWNYQRSEEYGSGHYKLDGSPGEEIMPVFSAHLSDDKRGVFIAIPDIREVMQMEVSYDLQTSDGRALSNDFWFTVNDVEEPEFLADSFGNLDVDQLLEGASAQTVAQNVEEPVSAERGKTLFQRTGCFACHSTDGTTEGKVGPTMEGLFGSTRTLQDGSSTTADEEYLRQSILEPGEQVVEGYEGEMPSFLGILSDSEINSIVEYIKTVSE
ncbi:c-type cytochrome [Aliifodinibius sp. S!AR15-10]|uniref:DUF6797 domain-containing protein n=1 Tax=Aliifodinibius sp. S!AR15-10 TaxID=2950437 RepID=UPI002854F230|nr:DUF6797 domain-containing protein [Aliifodinibius sp. S!AR15-10]MDR8392435.1 c-type cytochrome [Aliifodinibius sp. S!AR15-10]